MERCAAAATAELLNVKQLLLAASQVAPYRL